MQESHYMYLCKYLHRTYYHSRTVDSNDYNELPLQIRTQRTYSETTEYNFSTVQDWLPHISTPPTYNSLITTNTLQPASTGNVTEHTPSETTIALDQAQTSDDLMEHTEHQITEAESRLLHQETELAVDDSESLSRQGASAAVVSNSGSSQADANCESAEVIKPCSNLTPSTDTL